MQLDVFYVSLISVTFLDAIAFGSAAALLVTTLFGLKLKRQSSGEFSWLIGGLIGIIIGTGLGWFVMNAIGFVAVWSGSPCFGLQGADLTEWTVSLNTLFAQYQMHAVGIAMIGALFGIGWGYGVGAKPDDTSLLGNLIATIGVVAILIGMELTFLQTFVTYTNDVAFLYLFLVNGLILLGYGIMFVVNQRRMDSSNEYEPSKPEELIV